jgi:hypothetical protein
MFYIQYFHTFLDFVILLLYNYNIGKIIKWVKLGDVQNEG